ncbi:MAG TPA: PIN domain-containing protein [Gemmatimonadota bacterium]|nr:PIN domain-containing protein [Gemmatimonadota bacterium]
MIAGSRALLDTGVLVALLHRDDEAHGSVKASLEQYAGILLTTEPVLTEAMHLLGRAHGGRDACLEFFLRGAATIVPSSLPSLSRCREILARYADLPADFADATLIALSEEIRTRIVFTLDRRGFETYRDRDGRGFEIRP